jgi:hypothetical protein
MVAMWLNAWPVSRERGSSGPGRVVKKLSAPTVWVRWRMATVWTAV